MRETKTGRQTERKWRVKKNGEKKIKILKCTQAERQKRERKRMTEKGKDVGENNIKRRHNV